MKYQDVLTEIASEDYPVEVITGYDDILFEGQEYYGQQLFARMFRNGRTWKGYGYDNATCKGSKAKVADWCLGKAVDG